MWTGRALSLRQPPPQALHGRWGGSLGKAGKARHQSVVAANMGGEIAAGDEFRERGLWQDGSCPPIPKARESVAALPEFLARFKIG
jgi:hypothetical protein